MDTFSPLTLFKGLWAKKATSRRVPGLRGGRGPSRLPTLPHSAKELTATATKQDGKEGSQQHSTLPGIVRVLLSTQASEVPCEWDCDLHASVLSSLPWRDYSLGKRCVCFCPILNSHFPPSGGLGAPQIHVIGGFSGGRECPGTDGFIRGKADLIRSFVFPGFFSPP